MGNGRSDRSFFPQGLIGKYIQTQKGADLDKINEKLTDSGWKNLNSNQTVRYRKKNGIVTVIGYSGSGGTTIYGYSSGMTSLGTLPQGYRPAYEICTIGSPKDQTGYEVQFNIETNGAVKGIRLGNSSTIYWGFAVSYPVD